MASKSRAAQEALTELEKGSASFEVRLIEAAKFIGSDLDTICGSAIDEAYIEGQSRVNAYHGREEWLLRWLLKKLQAPKDDTPRRSSSSWRLLCYLLRNIPLSIVARILVERKFLSILQQTLEDAKEIASGDIELEESSESSSAKPIDTSEKSKKRKRSGELIKRSHNAPCELRELLESVHSVVDFMVQSTKPVSGNCEVGRSVVFSAEYMKTVIRTTAEDAAKILGSWLLLLKTPSLLTCGDKIPWLSPFIDIWENHITDDNDLMNFSLHCTLPLLSLQSIGQPGNIKEQAEKLIARNIMIPAKGATMDDAESKLLEDLTRISVISEPVNAASLFETAIRLIQPQGAKRRRASDDSWLKTVFATLKKAMPAKNSQRNGQSICAMLQSAIFYKVDLELPVLRSITAEYALPTEGAMHWELLSMIIKLDANVFLIPNDEKDLLQELLQRVTHDSFEPSWSKVSELVIENVLVPLMSEFVKARDLSGYIRHWYTQLVEFERLRKQPRLITMETFGAWEDEILQKELSKLLEASLTTQQIMLLLDWLEIQVGENPDAACIILEAISGSISREEVVDLVNLRCYNIMFANGASGNLDGRYKWRSWRIISQTLSWATPTGVEELAGLWKARANPFNSLTNEVGSDSLLRVSSGNKFRLDSLEILRCTCAAWSTAKDGSHMQQMAKPVVLSLLQRLSSDIRCFPQKLLGDTDMGMEKDIPRQCTLYRGIGWMILSFVRCVFVEYPKALLLASELQDGTFKEMLHTIFWVASAGPKAAASKNDWLRRNGTSFGHFWTSTLDCDEILNNSAVIETMTDIMLGNETHSNNPLTKSTSNNDFSIQSLLQLSVETFHRKTRERILKGWLPASGEPSKNMNGATYKSTALDPAVLALKVKVMQQPMFYEGMKFQELVNLGDALANSAIENPQVNLALLKEFSRLTIEFIFTNLEQPRNQEYITNAFSHIRSKIRKSHRKSKHKSDYATITLFQVVLIILNAKAQVLHNLSIISNEDLAEATSSFKRSLLHQLQSIIHKSRTETSSKFKQSESSSDLVILSIIDALTELGVDRLQLTDIEEGANSLINALNDSELGVGKRLHVFMVFHAKETSDAGLCNQLEGNTSTIHGRRSIIEKTRAAIDGTDNQGRLTLLHSILSNSQGDLMQLDKLFAVRHIFMSLEDTRKSKDHEDADSDNDLPDPFDLSTAYSMLCNNLWKATGTRQFCLISETLELMLRSKARSISQWNIDNTLGCISIICSRNAPPLRPSRAGQIFLHLCHLLQAILTSHRLKLEGHFHIVVQALQALLRCLFTPLPHSSAKILKYYAPPCWLTSISALQLTAKHAAAYTRLITLICDPSVSSVTRSQHNNLTSATDKAKRMAGQHMQFVLATYIKLQLEMKMLPNVREKMVPGLYAIFDTTTPELRRCISDSLDSSGRAVFGMLYKDYVRFGKWKGS